MEPLRDRLGALGPAPAEDEPPESPDIAQQRASISEDLSFLESRIKQIELVSTRVQELDSNLSTYTRERTLQEVLERYPFPLAPPTIAAAVPEFFSHLATLARSPGEWWRGLDGWQREQVVQQRIPLSLGLALAIGWLLRWALLRYFGRDPQAEDPAYARRLLAAAADGLADGIIPALIFAGLLYRVVESGSLISGPFADTLTAFCGAMILFVLAWALPRAALAPDLPNWRLEPIPPKNARRISRLIAILAAFVAIDYFLQNASREQTISVELVSFYEFVTGVIEAGLIIALTRGAFWRLEEATERGVVADHDEEPVSPDAAADRSTFWRFVRILVRAIALISVAATLVGYAALGAHLMGSLIGTGLLGGLLFLLRGVLREVIGVLLRSGFVQRKLGLRHRTRRLIKFWLRALIDLTMLAGGLMLVLPVWGVPARDLLLLISELLQGVEVGNVTISVTDVLIAIVIFALTIVVTRLLQRLLSDQVLPQTTLDSGVQNSITSGLGYLGIVLAGALGISALGLDLSNLALIAGALSVGIGFGLQTVVNNFVSGLILLIERPIKVGDWIIVSGHEGYVRRINVRATELETFQRASVIIPNSELVSTSVINWTHKNKQGRVEVPVGVAYGSDIEKVMQVMEDCLRAESRVLDWPEPYVLFRGFGDSSLDFEARGYIGDVEYVLDISSDMRVAIYKAFAEQGIEIPFPQRDLHLKDVDRLVTAIERRANTPQDGEESGGR